MFLSHGNINVNTKCQRAIELLCAAGGQAARLISARTQRGTRDYGPAADRLHTSCTPRKEYQQLARNTRLSASQFGPNRTQQTRLGPGTRRFWTLHSLARSLPWCGTGPFPNVSVARQISVPYMVDCEGVVIRGDAPDGRRSAERAGVGLARWPASLPARAAVPQALPPGANAAIGKQMEKCTIPFSHQGIHGGVVLFSVVRLIAVWAAASNIQLS